MNQIKFSHNYPKLWGQTEATLIQVRLLDYKFLNKDLIEYDTKTIDNTYYKLPNGLLIQLIFYGNKRIPFCTIRSFSKEKEKYYTSKIGYNFEIIIK